MSINESDSVPVFSLQRFIYHRVRLFTQPKLNLNPCQCEWHDKQLKSAASSGLFLWYGAILLNAEWLFANIFHFLALQTEYKHRTGSCWCYYHCKEYQTGKTDTNATFFIMFLNHLIKRLKWYVLYFHEHIKSCVHFFQAHCTVHSLLAKWSIYWFLLDLLLIHLTLNLVLYLYRILKTMLLIT